MPPQLLTLITLVCPFRHVVGTGGHGGQLLCGQSVQLHIALLSHATGLMDHSLCGPLVGLLSQDEVWTVSLPRSVHRHGRDGNVDLVRHESRQELSRNRLCPRRSALCPRSNTLRGFECLSRVPGSTETLV